MRIHVLGKYCKNWVLMTHPTDRNGCFITQLCFARPWNVLVHVQVPRPANARRADGRGQKAQRAGSHSTSHR
ncbi:hypothetical protein J3F84DRAFT_354202 [Trichoderma pleuroticola]